MTPNLDYELGSPELPESDFYQTANNSVVEHPAQRAAPLIRLPMGATMRRKLERLDDRKQK